MFRFSILVSTGLVALLSLAACSPTFNWREVRPEGTRLNLLLPCKPDKAQKVVPLGGRATSLSMLGCDAGDATFAVAVYYLAAGIFCLAWAQDEHAFSLWAMAVPFGVGQLLAAGILYWTLERTHGEP